MNEAWQLNFELKVSELDQTPGPKNFPALIAKVHFTGCLSLTKLLLPSVRAMKVMRVLSFNFQHVWSSKIVLFVSYFQ